MRRRRRGTNQWRAGAHASVKTAHHSPPTKIAETVARGFFGAGSDPLSIKRATRRWLIGAGCALILVPLIFYLRFGRVDGFGWGVTIFFVIYCFLTAVGLYFLKRPAYHTPVAARNDWRDRIGAFWLMACVFGPFFGWVLTSAVPLTTENWRWLYGGRVVLSIGLPILTALPLMRYVRGRGAGVMIALLVGVTALPIWSGWATWQDLWAGPVRRPAEQLRFTRQDREELYLTYTDQVLVHP
jgi:hypothetical protein